VQRTLLYLVSALCIAVAGCTLVRPESRQATGDWPAYGNDPGGMKHSSLTQITRENVAQLEVAWTARTGELDTYGGTDLRTKAAFEATPIMVDGTLYFSTPTDRVIALDAATGAQRWVFDPVLDLTTDYSEVTSRGVALWQGPSGRRIFFGTLDGRLIGLDAATGHPLDEFGNSGIIDLKAPAGFDEAGQVQVTSPPVIVGTLVIVGTAIGDNRAVKTARGLVRAYDVMTGALRWSWDTIPRQPSDAGYETWRGPIAHETGSANVWPPMSVDVERDLLFLPTTSPSPDYYGGNRIGQNLFANSVVALRASTGEMVWYFQTSHHDLWDYDVPMQPVLMPLERDGRQIPAVVIGTKQGHIFVLHRETGVPLFPVEERPVPQSDVPGEVSWPTQPFPSTLPVFGLRQVTPDDAWGLTPEELLAARQLIAALRFDGPFTPVSLQGSIEAPSNTGGFNWGGLTIDPVRGIVVGAVNRFASYTRLYPRAQAPTPTGPNLRLESEVGLMKQTPFVLTRNYLLNANRGLVPMTKPPWGTLAAVNLKTGALQFEVPLGFQLDPTQYPGAEQWGSISLGGPMSTAGGPSPPWKWEPEGSPYRSSWLAVAVGSPSAGRGSSPGP